MSNSGFLLPIHLNIALIKQAPEIVESFGLPCTASDVRRIVRAEFERNRYVSDPKVIDVLVLKGRQMHQEVMNNWAQDSHVLGILFAPKGRPQRTFMEKFLEGMLMVFSCCRVE